MLPKTLCSKRLRHYAPYLFSKHVKTCLLCEVGAAGHVQAMHQWNASYNIMMFVDVFRRQDVPDSNKKRSLFFCASLRLQIR